MPLWDQTSPERSYCNSSSRGGTAGLAGTGDSLSLESVSPLGDPTIHTGDGISGLTHS